jgi:predicted RNA binding protein YcfA (HicA-like mRNA interferase family)
MPRLPVVNGREMYDALLADGWFFVRQQGNHRHFHHPTKPGIVTLSYHRAGDTLPPGTVKGMLRQAGLTVDGFIKLLNK